MYSQVSCRVKVNNVSIKLQIRNYIIYNTGMTSSSSSIDYALDTAQLIDACCRRLALLGGRGHHESVLSDLAIAVASTERMVHSHLIALLEEQSRFNHYESKFRGNDDEDDISDTTFLDSSHDEISDDSCIMITAARLQVIHSLQSCEDHFSEGSEYMETNTLATSISTSRRSPADPIRFYPECYTDVNCKNTRARRRLDQRKFSRQRSSFAGPKEGGLNSLLFHLVSALQLCLLRIEDADAVLTGDHEGAKRRSEILIDELCRKEFVLSRDLFRNSQMSIHGGEITKINASCALTYEASKTISCVSGSECKTLISKQQYLANGRYRRYAFQFGIISVSSMLGYRFIRHLDSRDKWKLVHSSGRIFTAACICYSIKRKFLCVQVKARLLDSANTLTIWQQKWVIAANVMERNFMQKVVSYDKLIANPSEEDENNKIKPASRHLLECLPMQSSKGAFWYNHGAFRFLLVRRTMDLVYASVGTSLDYTGPEGSFGLWMPIACAAASYYAIAGADATSTAAAKALASPTPGMIKKAWGMVSLPAVKRLSLDVSKLLKGASCADKITICGVTCFVLSQEPDTSLNAAIKRFKRQNDRKSDVLPTICETDSSNTLKRRQSLSKGHDFPLKNVILHITGGGWFTHTIAGDIPYLLDWSGATNAVVICPEYALLPEYTYPTALNQIYDVYRALVSGELSPLLGFKTNKIIVTGESAGGNLATSLCVKLCIERNRFTDTIALALVDDEQRVDPRNQPSPLPSAIMLGCPALNMCFSPSPSRIMGAGDPVLPTGLLYAISRAYLPDSMGIDRSDPLVSPYFADDEQILSQFPPTLIFASAVDPLLDDSVDFNTRLKRLGVSSDLRSAPHMPHAFWGLGTAGFPEAKQVHKEACRWLYRVFYKSIDKG